jgi:hypothetical protein
VQERVGEWTVVWRPNGFSVRGSNGDGKGSFVFNRIVLPVEFVLRHLRDEGHAVLRLDPFARVDILDGSPREDLERFKRRVSCEVLAAVRESPFGCADCASEAGLAGFSWNGGVCPACREYCCRNPRCLRRLRTMVLRNGSKVCKHCGKENDLRSRPATDRFALKSR